MACLQVAENIWQVHAGVFPSNCYILVDKSMDALVIDPGLEPEAIATTINQLGVRPAAVLCTHGHFDHVGSASVIQRRYGVDVYMHAADMKTARAANFLLMAFKIPTRITLPTFTLFQGERGVWSAGKFAGSYRLVPGHSPGSCFIYARGACFSGDSLYATGVGLSKVPGEEPDVLRNSLLEVLDEIDPEVLVCPGHGRTALMKEIRSNNQMLAKFLQLGEAGSLSASEKSLGVRAEERRRSTASLAT